MSNRSGRKVVYQKTVYFQDSVWSEMFTISPYVDHQSEYETNDITSRYWPRTGGHDGD